MQQCNSSTVKRLMRDWKEVIDNPLDYIYAQPYPIMKNGEIEGYDMYNWFATLMAPPSSRYRETILSIRFSFDDRYPFHPPVVSCLTDFRHPHVFGDYICLDMLVPPSSFRDFYEGWSKWTSTYSVLSILLQLESFLLDSSMAIIDSGFKKVKYQELTEMGHDPMNGKLWPCAPHWNLDTIFEMKFRKNAPSLNRNRKKQQSIIELETNVPSKETQWRNANETIGILSSLKSNDSQFKSQLPIEIPKQYPQLAELSNSFGNIVLTQKQVVSELKSRACFLDKRTSLEPEDTFERIPVMNLPSEILREIFSYLDVTDLKRGIEKTCSYLKKIACSKSLIQERELICFHSKASFKEDILGVGLIVEAKSNGYVENISSPMDLVSRNSFYNDGATRSVWGFKTKFWIPIFINKKHADFEMFKSSVKAIYNAHPSITTEKGKNYSDLFNSPEVYIDLICKIMNSMVVDLMKGESHASTKYLQGYLYFHRWLLYILEMFPYKVREIERKVKNFIYHEHLRTKRHCPNLGEFLILLSVMGPSNLTWDSVMYAIVEETCTRNVLWAIKMYPDLVNLDNDTKRIQKTWNANQVSCKLLMFHVFFLKTVIEKEHAGRSLDEISRLYDLNFGLSPETENGQDLEDLVQLAIFKNSNTQDFQEFLEYIGLDEQLNSEEKILSFLKYCVNTSEKRRYHKSTTQ